MAAVPHTFINHWPQKNNTENHEILKRGYQMSYKVGEGSYAHVYKALCTKNNKHVAIKVVNVRSNAEDFLQKFFPRELEVLAMLDHPSVVKMHETFRIKDMQYIVLEFAGHGDLLDYIKLHTILEENKARFLFRQLTEAIGYLHSINIIHRDLKCENILLDSQNNIKVSDFGFARRLLPGEESQTYCGSAAYAAPEILQGTPYIGFAYDCWSLGIILYIMVTGKMPYDDTDVEEMQKAQQNKRIEYPSRLSIDVTTLIGQILEPDITTRATLAQMITSAWLKEVLYTVTPAPLPKSVAVRPTSKLRLRRTNNGKVLNNDAQFERSKETTEDKLAAAVEQHSLLSPKPNVFQRNFYKIFRPKNRGTFQFAQNQRRTRGGGKVSTNSHGENDQIASTKIKPNSTPRT